MRGLRAVKTANQRSQLHSIETSFDFVSRKQRLRGPCLKPNRGPHISNSLIWLGLARFGFASEDPPFTTNLMRMPWPLGRVVLLRSNLAWTLER